MGKALMRRKFKHRPLCGVMAPCLYRLLPFLKARLSGILTGFRVWSLRGLTVRPVTTFGTFAGLTLGSGRRRRSRTANRPI